MVRNVFQPGEFLAPAKGGAESSRTRLDVDASAPATVVKVLAGADVSLKSVPTGPRMTFIETATVTSTVLQA